MSRVATLAQDLDFALTSGSLIYIYIFLLLLAYDGRSVYEWIFFSILAATQNELEQAHLVFGNEDS